LKVRKDLPEAQNFGGLAQLGERLHGMQEVIGSSPLSSTYSHFAIFAKWLFCWTYGKTHGCPGKRPSVALFRPMALIPVRRSWLYHEFGGPVLRCFVHPSTPEKSLLLMKPTVQIKHDGGQRMVIGDRTYQQFRPT
jgi:hypothetical protein